MFSLLTASDAKLHSSATQWVKHPGRPALLGLAYRQAGARAFTPLHATAATREKRRERRAPGKSQFLTSVNIYSKVCAMVLKA